jgi:hypothetical protein
VRQETLWFLKVKRSFRVIKARVVKGPYELSKLEALKYVAQYTPVPVPKGPRNLPR